MLFATTGCRWPEIVQIPVVRNPFPQISKIAVAPFINLSSEASVDGRRFALAYFNELQSTPGFEVVPIGVVESAMRAYGIELRDGAEAQELARILEVDAVVIGAVTDYSPYYPPRLGLRVEWYTANPCIHPIPPGYGLPLGTPEEEDLPESLVYEAAFARARHDLKALEPHAATPPRTPALPPTPASGPIAPPEEIKEPSEAKARDVAYHSLVVSSPNGPPGAIGKVPVHSGLPPDCQPSGEPVLRHTRTYNGHDEWFVEALRTYYMSREDRRDGEWRTYLQRSEDFIRFCCHLHIAEMLSARGGAGGSELALRRPTDR